MLYNHVHFHLAKSEVLHITCREACPFDCALITQSVKVQILLEINTVRAWLKIAWQD